MIQLIIGAGLGLGGVAAAVAIKRYNEAEREKAAGPADHWGNKYEARIVSPACALPLILVGAIIAATACLYTQDTGEVCVIRNLGGSLAGSTSEAGFHAKAPWQDVVTYDVRNNLINFYGDTDYEVDGGSYEGKQVSINDKSGASANIDIQVNYSLNPDAALSLYSEYGTQESFVEKYISNDVRAVTREVSGGFDTVTMLTDRSQFTKAAQKAAEAARDRAVAAEVKGTRATTLASGSEATATMENNVLVVGVPKGDALRYSDLTAEQIAELKKPATDAAAGVNKVNNEFKQLKASVETAEKKRADAETERGQTESERKTSETERKEAETRRKTAEQKREQDSTKALADAQAALKDAKTAALNYQSIIDSAAAVTALGLKKVNGKICQMRKVGA